MASPFYDWKFSISFLFHDAPNNNTVHSLTSNDKSANPLLQQKHRLSLCQTNKLNLFIRLLLAWLCTNMNLTLFDTNNSNSELAKPENDQVVTSKTS